MFNLVLIAFVSLLCLNGFGLGVPVTDQVKLISDHLHELTISCSHPFLASEIAKALENCSIKPPPLDKPDSANEKQLLCAMYYEVNSKLCQSKFQVADFAGKYQQDVLVKDLCTESIQWTVNKIPWYPLYQTSLESFFKDKLSCSSLCHDPDKLHYVNNICKLYKVSFDLMHETKPITITDEQNKDKTLKNLDVSESNESVQVLHRDTMPADIITRKSLENVYSTPKQDPNKSGMVKPQNKLQTISQASSKQDTVLENTKLEQQEVSHKVAKVRDMVNQINEPPVNAAQPKSTLKGHKDIQPDNIDPQAGLLNDREPNIQQDASEDNADQVKPHNSDAFKAKQEDNWGDPAIAGHNAALPDPDPALPDPDPALPDPDPALPDPDPALPNPDPALPDPDPALPDPDPALPDPDPALPDPDPALPDPDPALPDPDLAEQDAGLANQNPKDTQFKDPNKPAEKLSSSHSAVEKLPHPMQKETFPIQPEFPSEDEDHFFSFFLTVIVLVALLYVLYHNKSKVIKVVMGLLVEGRQTGRRRNSRGHAYKRLDTLEQAMSTTTTAAPSKIIY